MITGLPPTPLVSGSGVVFSSAGTDLSYTQSASSITIASSTGLPIVISSASDTLAGVLDAPRAAIIDNLAVVASTGSYSDLQNQPDRQAIFSLIFDGGGAAIVAGATRYLYVPFNATITGWALMADQVGSMSVDIWKEPIGSFPPLIANSITGGQPLTLSSQSSMILSPTPVGWTTQINAGDCLAFHVTLAITVQTVTAELMVTH
jgi:hypothetical protein